MNHPLLSADVLPKGYRVTSGVEDRVVAELCGELKAAAAEVGRRSERYNRRNILSIPAVRALAASEAMRRIVEPVLGRGAFPVRGILFDKVAGANWFVGWHQDCAIAVKERPAREVAGFGPWSMKEGVVHVEPPVEVLQHMVTLRVHLDDCDETNGPLRVIPGSHGYGKLCEDEVKRWVSERAAVTCCAAAGDVLVMRPLLLHASSRVAGEGWGEAEGEPSRPRARRAAATPARHRRVVHIEYAASDLPGGLRWAEDGRD